MTNLKEQGYRFLKRGKEYNWFHPASVKSSDVDCTDMNDDEFERFVLSTSMNLPGVTT